MTRFRHVLHSYPELLAVLAAGVVGLAARSPLRWAVGHQGINALLVTLVFATALSVDTDDLSSIAASRWRLVAGLAVGITVLPALSWLVSRGVPAGPLRNGVLTIGLAPCEIASVTTATLAGGSAGIALVMLLGSTTLSVVAAGPILIRLAGTNSVNSGHLLLNLALVVLLPFALGATLRTWRGVGAHRERTLARSSTTILAALVALIASEASVSSAYLAVLVASLGFTFVAAAVGALLSHSAPRDVQVSITLTTSMRDFAIAAGIAATAFGPAAAAPLGLYGIVALVWGTALVGALRQRTARGVRLASRLGAAPATDTPLG
jgi:predicted Na+-dependent transporter